MRKVFFLIALMIVLTVIGDRVGHVIYGVKLDSLSSSFGLIKSNLFFLLSVNLILYLLDMLRMRLIGKAFGLEFSSKDCFGGVALNLLFGWISPMAIFGAPAMAFFLYKRGYPLVESITVSFIRSFSIILVSAFTTITIFSFNLQGEVHNALLQEKVFWVLCGIGTYISSFIVISFLPLHIRKKVKIIHKVTDQIRTFLHQGKIYILPILVLTLILNFLLVSFMMYEGASFYQNLLHLWGQVMLFLSYILLMPTPGASGLAEVGAPLIFSSEIPSGHMMTMVTAMRVSLIGIQVLVGMIFMTIILKQKITLDDLKQFKRSQNNDAL